MITLVVGCTCLLAFLAALAVSFALGPLGILAGAVCVAGAPVLGLRISSPFNNGPDRIRARAVIISVWSALVLGLFVLRGLAIPITQGDAFDTAWIIGMSFAIVLGAVLGTFWPSRPVIGQERTPRGCT
jgi:hypothetical protein